MKVFQRKIDFKDARGTISDILDDVPVNAITIITSKKGVSRGNHFHKKSVQYTYVVSGKIKYLSRKGQGKTRSAILGPGGLAVSPKGEAHTVVALADTVFLSITYGPRHGTNYEADTYRLAEPLK
ncbi:MAG TPA: cupin domain-containing protein [Elusimicrobiota bacterium]|nr:cupin domain-containing protein [Elusimicrobiota bacterium]